MNRQTGTQAVQDNGMKQSGKRFTGKTHQEHKQDIVHVDQERDHTQEQR